MVASGAAPGEDTALLDASAVTERPTLDAKTGLPEMTEQQKETGASRIMMYFLMLNLLVPAVGTLLAYCFYKFDEGFYDLRIEAEAKGVSGSSFYLAKQLS